MYIPWTHPFPNKKILKNFVTSIQLGTTYVLEDLGGHLNPVKLFSEKLFMGREGVKLFSEKLFMGHAGVF